MNETNRQKQDEECQEMRSSQLRSLFERLKKEGINFETLVELEKPGNEQEKAIPLLLAEAEKEIHISIKSGIYRCISLADWLKGDSLTYVLDKFFDHFENNQMLFAECNIEGDFEWLISHEINYKDAKNMHEIHTISIRDSISTAINNLISPKLVGHKKYQPRLQAILKNKHYRGKHDLVLAYAKVAKKEAIPDLIALLEGWDIDVLGSTIMALGNLKAKEAKPHLEKLLKHEAPYFRDLTRKALRKIG